MFKRKRPQFRNAFHRKLGVPRERYNEMFQTQEGRCGICGHHQSQFDKALALDHDHETGVIRGLLCTRCNYGLSIFDDSPDRLEAAARYLR